MLFQMLARGEIVFDLVKISIKEVGMSQSQLGLVGALTSCDASFLCV